MTIDWNTLCHKFQYTSPKRMLVEFYYMQDYSTSQIEHLIGVSSRVVGDKMRTLGLPLHSRGGTNNVTQHLACPQCGKPNNKLLGCCSLNDDNTRYIRWRLCNECGKRFKTAETVIEGKED